MTTLTWFLDTNKRAGWRVAVVAAMLATGAQSALAQTAAPAPPPPEWTVTGGAGLSLTSGNSSTRNYNLTFDLTHDPASPHLMKWQALYLRGQQNDQVTLNRTSLAFRDEYTLSPRAFVFGQLDYLRDTFKQIDYLLAATGGIGYKVIDTEPTKFTVDAGIGGVWEKNPGLDVRAGGAVTAGEHLQHQLNATTTLRHRATGLWKMDDFGDGLYTVSVGIATALAEHLQLSVDLLDTFKNRPPTAATKKNDVAIVAAIVFKY